MSFIINHIDNGQLKKYIDSIQWKNPCSMSRLSSRPKGHDHQAQSGHAAAAFGHLPQGWAVGCPSPNLRVADAQLFLRRKTGNLWKFLEISVSTKWICNNLQFDVVFSEKNWEEPGVFHSWQVVSNEMTILRHDRQRNKNTRLWDYVSVAYTDRRWHLKQTKSVYGWVSHLQPYAPLDTLILNTGQTPRLPASSNVTLVILLVKNCLPRCFEDLGYQAIKQLAVGLEPSFSPHRVFPSLDSQTK